MQRYIYLLLSFIQIFTCFAQNIATDDYIGFYQKFLSNQKNSRCAMYPSCSKYGQMAFKKFPFPKAISLTCERIMRCSHDAHYYDITYQYGYRSLVDYPHENFPIQIIHNRFQSPHTDILKQRSDRDKNLLFINQLINKEEYYPALLEIERLQFFNHSNIRLYQQKLLCYRGLKEYEEGIFEYETEFPDTAKKNTEVQMQAAILYYCTNNFNNVIKLTEEIRNNAKNPSDIQKANALDGILSAQNEKYDTALTSFYKNVGTSSLNQQNIHIINQMMKQKKKRPALARILSIIPGAGYLYTKHKGSALTAFIVNSLLGYATYTSIKSENYEMAGVCGFLSLSFYIGNINGAGRSATRYNLKKKNEQIRKLERINNIFY